MCKVFSTLSENTRLRAGGERQLVKRVGDHVVVSSGTGVFLRLVAPVACVLLPALCRLTVRCLPGRLNEPHKKHWEELQFCFNKM